MLDDNALSSPNRVFACIPAGQEVSAGYKDITFRQLADAVNHRAHWLEQSFGRSKNLETLTYLAIPDLRYTIMFLAAIKCGYKVSVLISKAGWCQF